MLLMDLVKEYEFHCQSRELSERTIRSYRLLCGYWLDFLRESVGITIVEDVRSIHCKAYIISLQKRGLKPAYINDSLKVVKCLFRYAYEEGYVDTLVTERVHNVRQPKVLIRTFNNAEIKRMLACFTGHGFLDVRNKLILMTLFDTGIRLTELTEMRLPQLRDGHILIHGKGNKERVVPKSPLLAKWFMKYLMLREHYFEYRNVPDLVFLSRNGKPLTNEAIAHMMKDVAKKADVRAEVRVSPHTCRHTFAHSQLRNGLDLYSLSRLMGHESVSITQRYLDGLRNEEVLEQAKKTGVLMNL